MSETAIEWTDYSWNPWHGCHKVSAGCAHCYMYRQKKQYGKDPGVVLRSKTKFKEPLKWKEPKRVFTCSWSDFFIEEADAWRDEAWEIIRQTPHLTYQILTKRPERMAGRLPWGYLTPWPNVWLGVSVENQKAADERIPVLMSTPAAVRFLSCEPLLGPVTIDRCVFGEPVKVAGLEIHPWIFHGSIDWVICGGESGPSARPMHPDWARSLRDQCRAHGVPFFFKQWGQWAPETVCATERGADRALYLEADGKTRPAARGARGQAITIQDNGKKSNGRMLDYREWNEFPEVKPC